MNLSRRERNHDINKDRVNAIVCVQSLKRLEKKKKNVGEFDVSTAVSLTNGSSRRSLPAQEGDSKVYFCI